MTRFTQSLRGKLAVYFAVAIVVSLLVSGLLAVGLVQNYLKQRTAADLEEQARSIAAQIEEEGLPSERFIRELERVQGTIVLLIPYREQVLEGLPRHGPRGPDARFSNRTLEFINWNYLAAGRVQRSEAELPGLDTEALVVAKGFEVDGELAGAVVVSKALSNLQPWQPIAGEFLIAALIALAISLVFALVLARSLSQPLHEITEAAVAVAEGDFSHEVNVRSEDEIGRLAGAFRHMSTEVQRSQQQQRDFIINVSHELKTPLTAISGHVEALRDGVAADPEAVDASLEVISSEARRLQRLIEDLLSLAKFDASQFELRSASIDMERLIKVLVDSFSREAGERGVHLETRVEAGTDLAGDPDRLKQILSNLVQNAIVHSQAGGSVGIHAAAAGGEVRIEVSDQGAGIADEDLPHIFDRFYRSGGGAREAGLGLGLAISRELARAMGGEIEAASTPGEGSTFTLTLPKN